MKKRLVLLTFCFSATCSPLLLAETGTVTIGPYNGLKPIKDNPFLAMSDKQFRPFAELLITSRQKTCAKQVFLGLSGKWNSLGRSGEAPDSSAKEARDTIETSQQMCYRSVGEEAQILGNDIGAFKHMKQVSAMNAGHKILDPRVYERARKMLPETTPQKTKTH